MASPLPTLPSPPSPAAGLPGRIAAIVFNNRIHVALMPVFLIALWALAFRYPLPARYYAMAVLSTAAGYLGNMLTDRAEDAINYPEAGRLSADSRWMKVLIAACLLSSAALAIYGGWRFILWSAVISLLGVFYARVIRIPTRSGVVAFRVKNVPWLKNAWSAIYWSLVLLLSPFIYLHLPLDRRLWLAIPIAFLLAFFVELLWDVRDVAGDRAAGVRTVPVIHGERAARLLLHSINVLVVSLALLGLLAHLLPPAHWMFVAHGAGAAAFIEWYFRQPDRQLGSHLYLLYAGACVVAAVALSNPSEVIWAHL